MKAIYSGMIISLSCYIYLNIDNNIIGSILFSFGLFTILTFGWDLFTGKAGLLVSRKISPAKLAGIYCGNLIGELIMRFLLGQIGLSDNAMLKLNVIISSRLDNTIIQSLILGFFCGILMYIAVTGFYSTGNALFPLLCIPVFILSGFTHCIADMFYILMSNGEAAFTLIFTTLGNLIGCNFIPLCNKLDK